MRKCGRCSRIKDLSEFYSDASKRSGYSSSCKKCTSEYMRERRKKLDPDFLRQQQFVNGLWTMYRLRLKDYEELMLAFGSACGICHSEEDLNVDHCHDTDKVRGVLCGKCNKAIGLLKDSPELLQNAINYLRS